MGTVACSPKQEFCALFDYMPWRGANVTERAHFLRAQWEKDRCNNGLAFSGLISSTMLH